MIMPRIDQRDYFYGLFGLKYNLILDNQSPDVVLYDDYSKHLVPAYSTKPTRIAFTGESPPIDYKKCHFALSFDEDHSQSIYLPLWILFIDWFNINDPYYWPIKDILRRPRIETVDRPLFCGFVAQNPVPQRNVFVLLLSKYKKVTCPGEVLNNYPPIGGRMGIEKENFLRRCKFTVAFENTSKKGYITEKILHAFQSRTIPIYWGSPTVSRYFNPKAFINCHNFSSYDAIIAEIRRLDTDDESYLKMINEPVFRNGILPKQFWPSSILTSIEKFILDNNNGE